MKKIVDKSRILCYNYHICIFDFEELVIKMLKSEIKYFLGVK